MTHLNEGVIVLENQAALKIQGFFAAHRLRKQAALHQACLFGKSESRIKI